MAVPGAKEASRKAAEDFFFDLELLLVGQFVTVAAEYFDSVVLPWIVRCGDDNARAESMLARREKRRPGW